jgi:hypothetical protein
MHFLVIFKTNLPLKRYKIALPIFWRKKIWWIIPVFFIWFDSNFDINKIWERNRLQKFCLSLDPEPDLDWAKMLDPDPPWMNPDPQPCFKVKYVVNLVGYHAEYGYGQYVTPAGCYSNHHQQAQQQHYYNSPYHHQAYPLPPTTSTTAALNTSIHTSTTNGATNTANRNEVWFFKGTVSRDFRPWFFSPINPT